MITRLTDYQIRRIFWSQQYPRASADLIGLLSRRPNLTFNEICFILLRRLKETWWHIRYRTGL